MPAKNPSPKAFLNCSKRGGSCPSEDEFREYLRSVPSATPFGFIPTHSLSLVHDFPRSPGLAFVGPVVPGISGAKRRAAATDMSFCSFHLILASPDLIGLKKKRDYPLVRSRTELYINNASNINRAPRNCQAHRQALSLHRRDFPNPTPRAYVRTAPRATFFSNLHSSCSP